MYFYFLIYLSLHLFTLTFSSFLLVYFHMYLCFFVFMSTFIYFHIYFYIYIVLFTYFYIYTEEMHRLTVNMLLKKTQTFDFLWLRYLHVTLTWLSCYNYSNKTKFIDFELIWSVQNSNYLLISGRIPVYLCASCSNKLRFHCQWQTCCCISFINNKHKLLSVTSSSVTLKYRMVSHPSCV